MARQQGNGVTLADGNYARPNLADVTVPVPGGLVIGATNAVTAPGTYTIATPATITSPPQRISVSNRSNRPINVQLMNTAGTVISVQIIQGAGSSWHRVDQGWQLDEGKPQARLDERYRTDLEFWDRARDHAAGMVDGEYALSGQKIVPQGYTTGNAADPSAYPVYVGSGDSARISSAVNGNPLGVFHQAQLAGHVLHLRARWTINPNTTNGGSTAGTANTGTVGLIAWQPGFNGNAAALNSFSPCHLSVNPTGFQYGVIYDAGGGTPAFTNIYQHSYEDGFVLAQDGTTIHSCEVVIDPLAINDSGGRGLAWVYAPDGKVHRISNNAIGAVPTATMAVFEIYKANTGAKLPEFVEVGADSRRTDRILEAVRDAMTGRSPQRIRLTTLVTGTTRTGTIVKPVGAKQCHIQGWAGGGGGGGGGRAATTGAQSGGAGGAGSSFMDVWVDPADLPTTIAYQVGAGGPGGAAVAAGTVATGGTAGTAGAATFLGASIPTYGIGVNGAGAGAGGQAAAASTAGATGAASTSGTQGTGGGAGANAAAGVSGGVGGLSKGSGGGGGGGGMAATTQAALAGGAGGYITGNVSTANNGAAATSGSAGANALMPQSGGPAQGGGGGGSRTAASGAAGNGGAGGFPGGGGGGGGTGAATGSTTTGAGGNGGDGLLIIDWYF